MRYAHGGGLTAAQRHQRELVRLKAADLFARQIPPTVVAHRLRVSRMSTNRWYRAWKSGGTAALASRGPGGTPCRLTGDQIDRLQAALLQGPAAHGWDEDQRWTLARITDLIHTLFGVDYTPRGVSYLMHRLGRSPQIPAHRAVERDEEVIAQWKARTWPRIKPPPDRRGPGCASRTSPDST
ncbi:winged helix-turn-helix domain-containing protein [Nocardiopsis sp. CC223A]|uniref:helix-turn-helix domain-containing protein n=1 Tax=Nocardiopsis sp. CC223A TaxID=3044051 RepID=UPI00278C21D4|nr:winged helix-turn-helix domain-containing protein [Nocardiopsis sp. CC223A]